ncbi:uncharacterized protein LOC112054835 [Bicyclus anynana]|uniref:Uncharacterized protein LOC112054835 n=1 Tax=Bicyclus anynana TaxID=110368 RepID=A0A6J1NUV0_BICAN|nr:uncharacterized protein LOC112054835 [Bicyclus anynana]
MLKQAVVFLSILYVAYAALALAKLEEKPKKFKEVEGCYISELDAVIAFGKSSPAKSRCMEYRCGKTYVQFASCGAVGASPPCYVVEDPTLPYPGCCPNIECPKR